MIITFKFGGSRSRHPYNNQAALRFGEALCERLGARADFQLTGNVLDLGRERFDAQDNPLTNAYNFGVHKYHRYIT